MNPQIHFSRTDLSFRQKIKSYRRRISEIDRYLENHPNEWGRFQSEFNQEINAIFRDVMVFQKENLLQGNEHKAYKLKRLFIDRFRQYFVVGEYIKWCLSKPYGYPGDYKIIDDIYLNSPNTSGLERLFDNYFQMSTISNAVRNRKEDFKQIVLDCIEQRNGGPVKILDLASGPCRDVAEVLSDQRVRNRKVTFHCFDQDERAISYGKKVVEEKQGSRSTEITGSRGETA